MSATPSTPISEASPDADCQPGLATSMHVHVSASGKSTSCEKLSNRHRAVTLDPLTGYRIEKRIKQRIEHAGQTVLLIAFRPDWWRGTSQEGGGHQAIYVSAYQELWAADTREAAPQWVKAKDLIPGRHVLRVTESKMWAEIMSVEPAAKYGRLYASVHELALEDSDSYIAFNLLLRARSIPGKVIQKRKFYPLKDVPVINYVPQPKSMAMVSAEVWYRLTSSLLPRCIDPSLDPVAKLDAMIALKQRVREVAAKACLPEVGWDLKAEFIRDHPIPLAEEFLPKLQERSPEILHEIAEAAIAKLGEPGPFKYSEFCDGSECHRIVDYSDDTGWKFEEQGWVCVKKFKVVM